MSTDGGADAGIDGGSDAGGASPDAGVDGGSTDAGQPIVDAGMLDGGAGAACLTIVPGSRDFGTLMVGCNSASKTFSIYNTCSTAMYVTSIGTCTGSAPCSEFSISAAPSIPTGGLLLNPGGSAPIQFQARYRPTDVGSDTGSVVVRALLNGQTATRWLGVQGRGDTTGVQVDTYTQSLQPAADILFVVDDSCSMQDKQNALASNFTSFIQYAVAANVDYQIGVTTTTELQTECVPGVGCVSNNSKGWGGRLVRDSTSGLKFVKPTTPSVSQVFSRLVNVGTDGAGGETALACATLALTPPILTSENAGFLRADANLAVVVVSDASDQSSQPVSYYQDLLTNVKGSQRLSYFTFSGLVPTLASAPSGCTYDDTGANSARYNPIITYTSGVRDEICNTNWAATLQNLGQTIFGTRTQFYLNNTPDLSAQQVAVKVNGVSLASGCPNAGNSSCSGQTCTNWCFDTATNSIKFGTGATPQPSALLEFEYMQACF